VSGYVDALQALIDALGRSAIPYMISGSTASGVHGVFRASFDTDLAADMTAAEIPGFVRELRGEFYADAGARGDALGSERSFNLIHLASTHKFDIFPLTRDPFQQSQFQRREIHEFAAGRRSASRTRGDSRRYADEAGLVSDGRRGFRAPMERCARYCRRATGTARLPVSAPLSRAPEGGGFAGGRARGSVAGHPHDVRISRLARGIGSADAVAD